MADIRIQYVTKSAPHHERITHLGTDYATWPIEHVIFWIENGSSTFHTLEAGKRAEIAVRQGAQRKYVQTHADNTWRDNLLSLPPCKVAAA
jgi:hypothetical protein